MSARDEVMNLGRFYPKTRGVDVHKPHQPAMERCRGNINWPPSFLPLVVSPPSSPPSLCLSIRTLASLLHIWSQVLFQDVSTTEESNSQLFLKVISHQRYLARADQTYLRITTMEAAAQQSWGECSPVSRTFFLPLTAADCFGFKLIPTRSC